MPSVFQPLKFYCMVIPCFNQVLFRFMGARYTITFFFFKMAENASEPTHLITYYKMHMAGCIWTDSSHCL